MSLIVLSFYFILRNNGTAMAVLAAPLPAALTDSVVVDSVPVNGDVTVSPSSDHLAIN